RALGADVLVEAQLAAGPDDAPQLGERSGLVEDRAEHERGDASVETGVPDRETLGGAVDNGDLDRHLGRRLASTVAQKPLGLDRDDLAHRLRIEREVEAVAGADLDHAAAEAGQRPSPILPLAA